MNELVTQLLAAFEAGQIERFSDLSEAQFAALKDEFGHGSFTPDQFVLLYSFVLVADDRSPEIDTFNTGSPQHKLSPATLVDGTSVLPISLLTWAGPGQGYHAAFELLMQLPVRRVTALDWPASSDL